MLPSNLNQSSSDAVSVHEFGGVLVIIRANGVNWWPKHLANSVLWATGLNVEHVSPYRSAHPWSWEVTGCEARKRRLPTKEVSLDWLDRLASVDVNAEPNSDYISPITTGLNELLAHAVPTKDFTFINQLLTSMQPPRMRSDVMVAVLRTLYPVNHAISSYRRLRKAVAEELSARGKDAARILRGIP
jgi:hypothetical protein